MSATTWSVNRSGARANRLTLTPVSFTGHSQQIPVLKVDADYVAFSVEVFGDTERRTLADFRPSGSIEAIAGGAEAGQLAHALGNTLSTSNARYATDVPVNLATIREVAGARRHGRSKQLTAKAAPPLSGWASKMRVPAPLAGN